MGAETADVKSIFGKAMELRTPDEQAAYLDQACCGDPRVRAEVESLLKAAQHAGAFFEALGPSYDVTVNEPVTERPGTAIGPYKLLEQIGEGGFGVVFMAEQQEPVRRKVALKILKPGMDTRQVIARFEAERQALALMDHPNIAHVFAGDETATGRPYFVMELVRGIPITDFCDQNQVPIRQRLELFLTVCQAVQHAHQKGIIHRDVKPSNVLVTLHDDKPVVKVIDFGIAKATGQQLTEKTLFTNFAQMIGTPLYMSPEQAQMSGLDVDTRSDIYSLGVLLYELLTGTTPFDKDRFKEAGYDEMRRIIREEEPPKPSTRISTMGQASTTASANRKSDPKRLSQLFRGELDWIVMKSLEKDRNRRYESASAFAADVQRYLNDEPVQACPPSAWYRFGKFARRNKTAMAVTTLVALLAVLAITGLSVGYVLIDKEKTEKEEALSRATTLAMEKEIALREKTAALQQAQAHLMRATALTGGYSDLANALANTTDPGVEKAYRGLLGFWKKLAADFPENKDYQRHLFRHHANLGEFMEKTGQYQKAAVEYRHATTALAPLVPAGPLDPDNLEYPGWLADAYQDLGDMLRATGQAQEAERIYLLALDIHRKFERDWPNSAWRLHMARLRNRIGMLFAEAERPDKAEKEYETALGLVEKQVNTWT
jgi:serine/threonine protein kinase